MSRQFKRNIKGDLTRAIVELLTNAYESYKRIEAKEQTKLKKKITVLIKNPKDKNKKRELIVIGTEKSAIADYLTPNEYRIFDTKIKKRIINGSEILEIDEKTIIKTVLEYKEPLKEEILHFVECLKDRKKPLTDGMVGYRTVKMCEAITQSARENRKIFF